MSSPSDRDSRRTDRPVLPSIRSLFGEELSRSPRPHHAGDRSSTPAARMPFRDNNTMHPGSGDQYSRHHDVVGPQQFASTSSQYPGYVDHAQMHSRGLHSHPPPHPVHSGYTPQGAHGQQGRISYPSDMYQGPSHSSAFDPRIPQPLHHPMGVTQPVPHYAATRPLAHHAQPVAAPQYSYQHHIGRPHSPFVPPQSNHPYSSGGGPNEDLGRYQSGQATTSVMEHPESSGGNTFTSGSKYECSYCGKGFTRPSSLKIHVNSHTGEKPFVCPVEGCGRSFSVLSNMRRHSRVHSQGMLKEESSWEEPPGRSSSGSPTEIADISPISEHATPVNRQSRQGGSS